MSLHLLLGLYAAVCGLLVGSYLNVVIHRLPRRDSTVLPRSRCPVCGATIRARDNVPLISFLLLRGRCRSCRTPISWRYPVVEASTAALFVLALEVFGPTFRALAAALFGCLLLALAFIDLEHFLLPDALTLPGLVIGLAISWPASWISPFDALLGAAIGGGGLWLLAESWYRWRGEEGMGLGDVKMLAMIGAFLGVQGVIVTLFLASLSGALVGLVGMATGSLAAKSRLPFGVFLAAGAAASLFLGGPLVAAYLELL